MIKPILFITLMIIGTSLCAARASCDSCGNECAPACGTRRFRPCCFNYLRRKRDQETVFWPSNNLDSKIDSLPRPKLVNIVIENVPEEMFMKGFEHEYQPYSFEDTGDN